jgi:alpha-ketoglutarate-dependent taurine dioxygenase
MNTLPLTRLHREDLSFESKISHKPFVINFADLAVTSKDVDGVLSYLRTHAAEIKQCVRANGTLLLRGLPITLPAHYQAALEALDYDLYRTNYGGASPRSNVTEKTFVSTEAPAPFIIGLHTEFCYQTTRPGMISFFCVSPAAAYGETPLFDCNAIWSDLSPALRDRLAKDGLLYKRFFFGKKSAINFRKTWRDTFQTEEKSIVEKFLNAEGMRFEWDKDDNLATELSLPAVLHDPLCGKPCISITMFNADSFTYNFRHFRKRYNPALRLALEWFVRREYSKPNTFLKVLHGSGANFTTEESAEIQRAAWANAIVFPWRTGDLLLIDNIRFGHARLNVRKPRRLIAAMADPYDVRKLDCMPQ